MSVALLVPALLAALAVILLLADLAPGGGGKRGIGVLTAFGLGAIGFAAWYVPESEAFDGRWAADLFTRYAQVIILAAGAVGAVATIDHADLRFPRRQGEYYLLYVTSIFGMALMPGVRDVVGLAVAFETMSIPLYVLTAMHKDQRLGIEGSVKLYLTGAVSAAVTIYGLSFLVGAASGTRYAEIAAAPHGPLLALGAMLALAGMAYKLGAVPFHFWIPDTYQAAPGPVVAFISVAPKAATVTGLLRLFHEGLGTMHQSWSSLLLAICVLTMLVGNLLAIPQSNVRRLLAFSGVAHIGLVLMALSIGTPAAAGAILFYLVTYVASNMGAFFAVEAIGSKLGDDIAAWAGMARRNPALSLILLIALLSLGGIPFVAGFWGKLLLFWAVWIGGQKALVFLGAVLAVLGLFYYLRVARSVYIDAPPDPRPIAVSLPTWVALGLALAGMVGIGLYPRPFVSAAMDAGKALAPIHMVAEGP